MENPYPKRKHLTRIPVWLPLEASVIYFVTVCCAQRRRVFTNVQSIRVAVECMLRVEHRLRWQVLNCCLMPDHVHLLLAPMHDRDQSLSKFMQRWKSCVTLRMKGKVDGGIWQREFFDHLLRSDEKLEEKWEYIRYNSVRVGLCSDPDGYPYAGTPEQILKRLATQEV